MNSKGKFVQNTTVTFATGILSLLIGVGTSVILARVLGPEGKGIYALATLLPSLIVTFGNLGIGPATVYYVARNEFNRKEILGNNVFLSLGVGAVGIIAGLVVVFFFGETVFPGVPVAYLLLALVLVPVEIFSSYIRCVLLGAQSIKEFNYVQITQSALFLGFIALALLGLRGGASGAILAGLATWLLIDVMTFRLAMKVAGGISLRLNVSYIKQVTKYGLQAHLANILGFLNYRVDMFLVNGFLGPAAVGLYSVGVGLVEKLWLISNAAGTVLFPRVAAESEEERRKEFTPLVARTVLWMTAIGALVLIFLSGWIVHLLYSDVYLPAIGALQALLPGIVTFSAGRVLSNDVAGRGHPGLSIYTGIGAVITNVVLNIIWIPGYGIVGAAWASTVSYTVSFVMALFFYCGLSGNSWTKVIFPQRGDWTLYEQTAKTLFEWINGKAKVLFGSDRG